MLPAAPCSDSTHRLSFFPLALLIAALLGVAPQALHAQQRPIDDAWLTEADAPPATDSTTDVRAEATADILSAPEAAETARREAGPLRFVHWTYGDAVGFARAVPTHRTLFVAGASAGLLAVSLVDEPAVEQARTINITQGTLGRGLQIANFVGDADVVRPVALALFGTSLLTNSRRFQDAAFTSLQALLFANAITGTLKLVAGRARPWQGEGAGHFDPFSGNTSFPSGHATTAWAFLTPWMLYYPGPATAGLAVVATGTAIARMTTNMHWLSDVLAGSAIGFTTALLLTRRHQQRSARLRLQPSMSHRHIGVRMTF